MSTYTGQLTSTLTVNLNAQLVNAIGLTGNAVFPLTLQPLTQVQTTQGVGANGKANAMYSTTLFLPAGTTVPVDFLTFGGAVDALGNAVRFANIKTVIIDNAGSLTNSIPNGIINEADAIIFSGTAAQQGFVALFGGAGYAGAQSAIAVLGPDTLVLSGGGASGYPVTVANRMANITSTSSGSIAVNLIVIGDHA